VKETDQKITQELYFGMPVLFFGQRIGLVKVDYHMNLMTGVI
jgi:hypothetical protein